MTKQEKLDLCINALEFYANKENYKDTHKCSKQNLRVISIDDCYRTKDANYGGETARETLRTIREN